MIEQEAADADQTQPRPGRRSHVRTRSRRRLDELNAIIATAGPLVPGATQAVLGEGPVHADDRLRRRAAGRPGGPAGPALRRPGRPAPDRGPWRRPGSTATQAYLTNAVKHFKFEQRGKRRIHAKPTAGEVKHYRPWLMKELELVRPKLVVALGATAVLALTGKATPDHPLARTRRASADQAGYITVHPSYLLRLPDEDDEAARPTRSS